MNAQKIVLIVCAMSLFVACAGQQKMYRKAVASNSIEAYKAYLKKYPASDSAAVMKKRLEELEYEKALMSNRVSLMEDYLESYPNGVFRDSVLGLIEDKAFQQTHSEKELRAFLRKYPQSRHENAVLEKLEKMEYEKAHSISDLSTFIENYPDSQYRKRALKKLEDLEYRQAKDLHAYQAFIQKYPGSARVKELRKKIEKPLYEAANDKASLKAFLQDYPKSEHADDAKKKLIALEFSDVKTQSEFEALVKLYPDSKYAKRVDAYDDYFQAQATDNLEELEAYLLINYEWDAAMIQKINRKCASLYLKKFKTAPSFENIIRLAYFSPEEAQKTLKRQQLLTHEQAALVKDLLKLTRNKKTYIEQVKALKHFLDNHIAQTKHFDVVGGLLFKDLTVETQALDLGTMQSNASSLMGLVNKMTEHDEGVASNMQYAGFSFIYSYLARPAQNLMALSFSMMIQSMNSSNFNSIRTLSESGMETIITGFVKTKNLTLALAYKMLTEGEDKLERKLYWRMFKRVIDDTYYPLVQKNASNGGVRRNAYHYVLSFSLDELEKMFEKLNWKYRTTDSKITSFCTAEIKAIQKAKREYTKK